MTLEDEARLYESERTVEGEPVPFYDLSDFAPLDLWVVAAIDDRWLLHDLPEPSLDENGNPNRPYPGLIARSGDVLLVQTGDGWVRFDVS